MRPKPPPLAHALLRATLPRELRDTILGDVEEKFYRIARTPLEYGDARRWYWKQAIRSLNPALRIALRQPTRRHTALIRHTVYGDMMRDTLHDIRYAIRTFMKNPAFTVVTILTLALGIGANTAIFSVVDGILLKPLPYPEPNQLVSVWADYTRRADGPLREWLSFANFHDLRQETDVFSDIGVYQGFGPTLTGKGEAQQIAAAQFSVGMFSDVLGVEPLIGRSFLQEEGEPGAQRVTLVSHGFWTRVLGADPSVLGTSLMLDEDPHVIVGVMPAGFRPPFVKNADVWRPMQRNISQSLQNRGFAVMRGMGRMAPGVTLETARARATAIGSRLEEQYPESNLGVGYALFPLRDDLVAQTRTGLWVLLAAVGFVLLIACVNVANLLLARGTTRSGELAIRAALGANRSRIVTQLMTESGLLALMGGVTGLVLAFWGTDLLVSLAPQGTPRIDEVAVDGRILGFAAAITVAAGFLFGILPALKSSRGDLQESLKEGGRGAEAGARKRGLRSALVITQVALALVLLTGAGLLLRSFQRLNAVDLGFNPQGLLTASLGLPVARYADRSARYIFFTDLEERVRTIPGVEQVGSTYSLPLTGNDHDTGFKIEGRPVPKPGEQKAVWYRQATPGYLEAVGISVLEGRTFTASDDAQAPPVVIINETLASRHFADGNPIGQRISLGSTWREIIGVAQDIKNFGIQTESRNALYLPYAQAPTGFLSLVIRASVDPVSLMPAVRREIAAADPNLALSRLATMETVVRDSLASEQFLTRLLSLFAAVALVLAAVGLYGVVSYGVSRRSREMGVRIALGAAGSDIGRLVVGQSLGLVAIGVGVGLVGAYSLTRLLEGLLFGVEATDPITFLVVTVVLGVVSVAASVIPARRAAKVDPVTVLHSE